MDQSSNKLWSALCGVGGGMGKYFLQINDAPFIIKLCQAGATALLCGLLGAMGKYLFDSIMKRKS
jgi:hypothetical protein